MVRPVTQNLVDSIMLDIWPRSAAIVDFGIDSQEHYEALYGPIRSGEVTPEQLDAVLGDGKKLTALARSMKTNPHKDIVFKTSYDWTDDDDLSEGATEADLGEPWGAKG